MRNALTWSVLKSPDIAGSVDELRATTLRLLLWVTAAGYLIWHAVATDRGAAADFTRLWLLFPAAALVLAGTAFVQGRGSSLGAPYFLVASLLTVTAAIVVLGDPSGTILFPLLALVAVVVLHPLAGLAVAAASVGLLALVHASDPSVVGVGRIAETAVASLLSVVVAWALARNLVTAVEWSFHSSEDALRNLRAARDHRAELVRALRQLDTAFYQLRQANAALEVAWKAAETAERSKTEFVTNISHELRTPLNLIVGFSEIMMTAPENYGQPLPPAYRSDLNAIYRNAQHLLALSNDVIDLARVGVGRLALSREPVRVDQLVHEAADIVREYVAAKGLELRLDLAPNLPTLPVDRLRIRQVLLNLLTNAARFTERGGITIEVSIKEQDVLVRVSDTGPGIAPRDLARVFDEFYSGDERAAPPAEQLGGIGLGLPISRRLVALHGGQMGVESEPGRGTTFWFTLPITSTAGEVYDPAWRPNPLSPDRPPGERVLVLARSDRRLQEFLQRHLRGVRVLTAPDLRRAGALALRQHALAILADVDHQDPVPTLDLPVPVFYLPLPIGDRLAAALGAQAYLVKPITRSELRAAIAGLEVHPSSILVVDDNAGFVRLISRMLQGSAARPAYELRIAHNGREALDLMRQRPPDLVLLDLVMPELGGADVLAAMRADPHLATLPAIIISSHDEITARLPEHATLAVHKPEGFLLEEILGTVEALLHTLHPPRGYLESATPANGARTRGRSG